MDSYYFMPNHGIYLREPDVCATEVGEDMPISRMFGLSTVFITAPDKRGKKRPIGTGFLATFGTPGGNRWLYLITARHVIARREDDTHVRLRKFTPGDPKVLTSAYIDGAITGVEDFPCGPWYKYPGEAQRKIDEDVAVTPLRIPGSPGGGPHYHQGGIAVFPIQLRPDPLNREPLMLGDRIHYVGLLEKAESLATNAQPIVRTGGLAAWHQSGIVIRPKNDVPRRPTTVHLGDVGTWRGFSGSPVWIEWRDYREKHSSGFMRPSYSGDRARMQMEAKLDAARAKSAAEGGEFTAYDEVEIVRKYIGGGILPEVNLIGMLVGFVEDYADIDSDRHWETTGICVIIPIERIQETLMQPKLEEERKMREEDAWKERKEEGLSYIDASVSDDERPGPDPERLKLDGSLEDIAKRVMDAGKPDDD